MLSNLVIVLGAEEDGDEGEPDDAGAVHGEADVLGLVEVLGDLARLEGVPRAQEDEHHVVAQAEQDAEGAHAARQDGRVAVGVDYLQEGVMSRGLDELQKKPCLCSALTGIGNESGSALPGHLEDR